MPCKQNLSQKAYPAQRGKQAKSAAAAKPGACWVAPKTIAHPEHHHTLNHLNQVAAYYSVLSSSSSSSSSSSWTCATTCSAIAALQTEIARSAKTLSRKAVIRLDTGVKRGTCPRCDTVWVEGLTAETRIRGSGPHDHVVKYRCHECGGMSRRPAPDLVPKFQSVGGQVGDESKVETQKAIESQEENQNTQRGKRKISQRKRRRTGSIKRQLLHTSKFQISQIPTQNCESEATRQEPTAAEVPTHVSLSSIITQPAVSKLSRSQKRKQRLQKLALRAESNTAPTMSVQGRRKIPKYRPEEIGIPPIWTFPEDHVTSTHPEQLDDSSPTAVPPLDEVESKPNRAAKGRNPRPSLPHFNDRVQGSHWDLPFSLLHTLLNRHENTTEDLDDRRVVAQAKQTLEYWENAARSRGDHLVVAAVGKNGTLGPSVS